MNNLGTKGKLYYTKNCVTADDNRFSLRGRCFQNERYASIEFFRQPNCGGEPVRRILPFGECVKYFPEFDWIQKYGLEVVKCL